MIGPRERIFEILLGGTRARNAGNYGMQVGVGEMQDVYHGRRNMGGVSEHESYTWGAFANPSGKALLP